jgi:hypothetical protein
MANHDRKEVDRILLVMRNAMRALVARSALTYDNQLSVTQKLILGTFSGWEQSEVPGNMSMLLRDLAIYHDDQVGAETTKITEAFEIAERWILEATRERPRTDLPGNDLDDVPSTPHEATKRGNGKTPGNGHGSDVQVVRETILKHLKEGEGARGMDELIVCCYPAGNMDRGMFANEIRVLQDEGQIVEVDLDLYAARRQASAGEV